MDTRTPRTPTGDRSSGYDDAPALSMVKVPSDPAQIIVNHASFRVQLGAATRTRSPRIAQYPASARGTARTPVVGTAGAVTGGQAAGTRRRAPVVWSGKSAPDDTGATRLLQAARSTSVRHGDDPTGGAGATRVFPAVGRGERDGYGADMTVETVETPLVGSQRAPAAGETRLLPHMRQVGSAYDEPAYADDRFADADLDDEPGQDEYEYEDEPRTKRHGADPVRHAYYPGRRMNLGVVLLPLRVFLGFISIYAGMGKLCDPVYFDGGKRGSMVKWLNSLHPWETAEPLRQFALQHPVGAGLVIAFLQVVVGVLTVLGLWQRVAAVVGAGLSAALLLTVSWKTVPAYDAPDIIYLAAWSPLITAGAPVYSVDGRLASEAWRRLGPRADIWELRQRVLRRGALVTTVVVGLTLLVGSLLGSAVRDADRVVVPGPGEAPRNELPGTPLPGEPGRRHHRATPSPSKTPTREASSTPSGVATTPGAAATPGTTGGVPSQTQGTNQAPPQRSAPAQQAPSTSTGPASGGSTSGGTTSGGTTGGGSGGSGSGGSGGSGGSDRLVGGLLG